MAAVAGSKGKIEECGRQSRGPQLSLVGGLLSGNLSAADAAQALLDAVDFREIGVDTNMICNLRCQYCYLSDREEQAGQVPLGNLGDCLAALVRSGVKLVAFIGKEPLADPRATTLVGRLAALRGEGHVFRTGMVTNGTLVDRWLDQLVEADLSYLDISIDGLTDADNQLRADVGLAARARRSIKQVVASPLQSRFATATVLSAVSAPRYRGFVETMFSEGVATCFSSPVLRFAMSNEVADYALSLPRVLQLCEELARISADDGKQIIVDMPYRYTWELLRNGSVPTSDLREDRFEAIYYQVPGSSLIIKMNPFPFSFWRALRVTHDGEVILNMDLAAHPDYRQSSVPFAELDGDILSRHSQFAKAILAGFVRRHCETNGTSVFERDLEQQLITHRGLAAVA